MNRYWLFMFERCYPFGGFQDFKGSFKFFTECHNKAKNSDYDHYQIFDSKEQKIIIDTEKPEIYEVYKTENFSKINYPELSEIYTKELLKLKT